MQLQVVTPEGPKVELEVRSVTAPGTMGDLGILPGHRPLLTSLRTGLLNFEASGPTEYLAVSGGYLEVADDTVVVITETAERPDEVDVERAQKALAEAQKDLASAPADEPELANVHQAAIERAQNRLAVAKHVRASVPR